MFLKVHSFVLSLLLLAVRIDNHKSAAKLLCPPLVGSIEDEATATAYSKALVYHVEGRMIGFPEKSIFTTVAMQKK